MPALGIAVAPLHGVSGAASAATTSTTEPTCSQTVPSGGHVNAVGNIYTASGQLVHPKCITQPLPLPHAVSASTTPTQAGPSGPIPASSKFPAVHDWYVASWHDRGPSWLSSIAAQWRVPTAPKGHNKQTNYLFPSLENPTGTAIVQPVLQWTDDGKGWRISSWYIGKAGTLQSAVRYVKPGDLIKGWAKTTKCHGTAGRKCDWAIVTKDLTKKVSTTLKVTAPEHFTNAQGGVLENWYVKACGQLPASGRGNFTSVQVRGAAFTVLKSPKFQRVFWRTVCSDAAPTVTATRTLLTWAP